MLEIVRIPQGMGLGEDLFFVDCICDDGGEEILFIAGEDEVGQFAGDNYNWDNGNPETYTFQGDLQSLFELLKGKSEPDESSEWLDELI